MNEFTTSELEELHKIGKREPLVQRLMGDAGRMRRELEVALELARDGYKAGGDALASRCCFADIVRRCRTGLQL